MKETIKFDKFSLTLDIPEGFHIMDNEEIKKVSGRELPNQFCLRDTTRKLMYNITWKKVPILGKFAGFDKMVKNTKKNTERILPTFEMMEWIDNMVDGNEAKGFRYSYVTKNQKHVSDYLVINYKGYYIAFMSISRMYKYENNLPVFDSLIKSVKFEEI